MTLSTAIKTQFREHRRLVAVLFRGIYCYGVHIDEMHSFYQTYNKDLPFPRQITVSSSLFLPRRPPLHVFMLFSLVFPDSFSRTAY